MQAKFDNALEAQQRNVKAIVTKDTRQLNDILSIVKGLKEVFNNSHKLVENPDSLAAETKAPNVITGEIFSVSYYFSLLHKKI